MDYEIRSEGLTDFEIRFRALGEDYRERTRVLIGHAANEAGTYMAQHVPFHSGQMYRAINVSEPKFHPGGAGGGGYWQAEVGVDREIAPHAEWVIEGTGMHKTSGVKFPIHTKFGQDLGNLPPSAQRAVRSGGPKGKGLVMAFEKEGEGTVFTHFSRGQRPQRAWFEEAMRKADRIISRRISRL